MAISPSQRYVPLDCLLREDSHIMAHYGEVKAGQRHMAKNALLLHIMDRCADRCHLRFAETGLHNKADDSVRCFDNCLHKSYDFYIAAQGAFNALK